MNRHKSLAALAAGSALALSSQKLAATITASLVPVSIAPDALTDDPNLANYRTFDLIATPSEGTRWIDADMRAQLTAGKFYIPPHDDLNIVSPLRNTPGYRFLQDDTFVTVPIFNGSQTGILGRSKYAPASQGVELFPSNGSNFPDDGDPNGTTFLPANDMRLVDAAWGYKIGSTILGDGTYTVARLTVTNDAVGQLIGRFPTSGTTAVSFTFTIPEPGSMMMLCAGLGALALRRK